MKLFTAQLLSVLCLVWCQMPQKTPIVPLLEDVPFIKCEVCMKGAKAIYKAVRKLRNEGEKLDEEGILASVEKLCDAESMEGNWITKLDIVEEGSGLKLVEHTNEGKCLRECKTISYSCVDTIGDADTDIGELLWINKLQLSPFINKVCHSVTNACAKHSQMFVKGKRKDHKFVELTEKEKQAMDVMKNMRGVPGMPGMEMYSPEDLSNMREQMGINDNESPIKQGREDIESNVPPTQLGFMDTFKALISDTWRKTQQFFGFHRDEL